MPIDFLKRLGLFFVFVLAQTMVLGRIHLFGYATPLLYVYFVAMFNRNYPKWAVLLWSFAMGLTIDIFSNTPGVAAASLTLIGAIQPYFLEPFIPRDSVDDLRPSIRTIGVVKYVYYITILVVLYCLVFFSLEAFNFFNWMDILKSVGGSAVITLVLILTFESVSSK
ncbi:MAG: rod shape-determining protein MreD [Prevotella sp.]|nr:rod shape-determining protein MreD [Prevotella sp.]